jgi:hypothetical protein
MKTNKTLSVLAAAAALGLISIAAQARTTGPRYASISEGRTAAIRARIADWINARKIAHVNYDIGSGKKTRTIKPSEVRISTAVLPGPLHVRGVETRKVDWRLGNVGYLRGTARASTPTVVQGGKLTKVYDVKTSFMPKIMAAPRRGGRS